MIFISVYVVTTRRDRHSVPLRMYSLRNTGMYYISEIPSRCAFTLTSNSGPKTRGSSLVRAA
ncbi:MAG: hypothetical protein [CRESS virus sp. ct6pe1]|uniref:Uncharacterized protein n=1 Tax=CRESS virus sp. ct6pe1 TaxID=2656676 RepID=A0A5Q2W992_9VIRU|nr:MAG: hypothetical protein [CRESS virus sp. ct6pe1]